MGGESMKKGGVVAAEEEEESPKRKYASMKDVMRRAKHVTLTMMMIEEEEEEDVYGKVMCEECGEGDREEDLLLCDACDKGFHMLCSRPIVPRIPIGPWFCTLCSLPPPPSLLLLRFPQKKIVDFFRIKKCGTVPDNCQPSQDIRKRRRRSSVLVLQKRRRRLLPFTPTEDDSRRLAQMSSLAYALTASKIEFSNELTYMAGMAPRSANQAEYENGGMQVLSREDFETLKQCKAMFKRGECPPLLVVFDSCEGFTVEADELIKDMTLVAEYTGDVDYIKNREHDDCDSMMSLLLTKDSSKSLVVCPDKRGNIARFISGINNHAPESRKKQNLKCLRYNVDGECRVFLVAMRDISKGERLYYDYNGYEHEYPTHHFV